METIKLGHVVLKIVGTYLNWKSGHVNSITDAGRRQHQLACILLSCWPGSGCYSPRRMLYQSQSINPSTILLHSSRDRLRVQLIRSRRPLGAQLRHQPRNHHHPSANLSLLLICRAHGPCKLSSVPMERSQWGGYPAVLPQTSVSTLLLSKAKHRPIYCTNLPCNLSSIPKSSKPRGHRGVRANPPVPLTSAQLLLTSASLRPNRRTLMAQRRHQPSLKHGPNVNLGLLPIPSRIRPSPMIDPQLRFNPEYQPASSSTVPSDKYFKFSTKPSEG